MIDWKLFLSTFTALFIAELGDKTQLAVIMFTSKNDRPLSVFLGASAALVCVTLLGVLGGQALLSALPADLLHKLAAGSFVILGLLMWFGVL